MRAGAEEALHKRALWGVLRALREWEVIEVNVAPWVASVGLLHVPSAPVTPPYMYRVGMSP
jgi:hypothetical protein